MPQGPKSLPPKHQLAYLSSFYETSNNICAENGETYMILITATTFLMEGTCRIAIEILYDLAQRFC